MMPDTNLTRLPLAYAGMRVGLFGGSFDPPHAGHLEAADTALRACRLDAVWWLPTPRNTLKPHAPASLASRIASIRALIGSDGRHKVSAYEASLSSSLSKPARTHVTLQHIVARNKGVAFVWICGADSFAEFDRWVRPDISTSLVTIAACGRPGSMPTAGKASHRIRRVLPAMLGRVRAPAWAFVPMHNEASSSAMRTEAP